MSVINGGSACNVFWQVGSSATIGTTTQFIGNILALTSITLNTGASLSPGRALARNGATTMDSNNISIAGCASGSLGWPGDNRVNPKQADVFASYCDATAYRVILINQNSAAGLEWSIPYATLIAAGPAGVSKDFGKYGIFSIMMDGKGYFHAALNGGLFNSNGQGSGAKDANCSIPATVFPATSLPATGYAPSTLPNFIPEKPITSTRRLILSSGKALPIVESDRAGDSWSVGSLASSVGHLAGTSWLDDSGGNIVLVGHVNDAHGNPGPFAALSQAKTGDVFTLQDGTRQVSYHVITVSSVLPQDMQVIIQDGRHRITLITCSDWDPTSGDSGSFKTRLVIVAVPSP